MVSAGKDRGAREARERSRLYQARQGFQDGLRRRRIRDNVIAGVGGGIVLVALVVAQTLYFTAGPGAPAPEPTSTPSPSVSDPAPAPTTPEPTATEPASTPSPSATD